MNVLAIGGHPDDIEILCGGTLALYAEQGGKVFMAVATNGNVGTPDLSRDEIARLRHGEQQRSCDVIGAELIWMNFDDEWLFNDRPTRTAFLDAIRRAKPDVMFIRLPLRPPRRRPGRRGLPHPLQRPSGGDGFATL
jgi:LmbE family N-acetylglucosaminyl deacetylase